MPAVHSDFDVAEGIPDQFQGRKLPDRGDYHLDLFVCNLQRHRTITF